jgi:hypothetical protein
LVPQLDQLQLSFHDGAIAKSNTELMIEALEALPAVRKNGSGAIDFTLPSGVEIHDPEDGSQEELSDEAMDKLAEEMSTFI